MPSPRTDRRRSPRSPAARPNADAPPAVDLHPRPRSGPRHGVAVGRDRARNLAAGALVAAIALALSSCTGPDTAEPSPSLSTTGASASPSPSRSTPPERPAAMDRSDVEGAIAAAQYFLELYPYAYNTGDLTTWKAMSHPECVFCASVIENVETLHAAGGYQTGGDITWTTLEGRTTETGSLFSVDANAMQTPTYEVLGEGNEEISPGGAARLYIDLAWTDAWTVRGVDVEDGAGA